MTTATSGTATATGMTVPAQFGGDPDVREQAVGNDADPMPSEQPKLTTALPGTPAAPVATNTGGVETSATAPQNRRS